MKYSRRVIRFISVLALAFVACDCSSKTDSDGTGAIVNADSTTDVSVAEDHSAKIPALCEEMNAKIAKWKWDLKTCEGIQWKAERLSVEGRPLIYAEFGEPTNPNKTLIFSMVHPDEITPLYLAFQLAQYLREREGELKEAHVILAPFVNPDGFYREPPIRMNARGVDVNRNFDTPLWREKALRSWNTSLKKNPRRFPGHEPSSEPETKFQEDMIQRFAPTKILSMHAPLNVTDYDGPSSLTLDRFPREYVRACYQLRARLRAKSTGFFPGSLGNYAGVEKGIPTVTLELPSANPRMAAPYWKKFRPGIHSMIHFRIDAEIAAKAKEPKKVRK
jgi:protein MpaA